MADYAVNDFTERAATLAACLALLETKIETIDDGKTIRHISIHQIESANLGKNLYEYALIVDA